MFWTAAGLAKMALGAAMATMAAAPVVSKQQSAKDDDGPSPAFEHGLVLTKGCHQGSKLHRAVEERRLCWSQCGS